MDTQGARQVKLRLSEATRAISGDDVTEVQPGDFRPVSIVFLPAGYGNISVWAGKNVTFLGSVAAGTPFQVDFRLYQGRAECLWDSIPVAAGPAIFPTGPVATKPGEVDREGVMFAVDGTHAVCFLLHARVVGLSQGVKLPIGVEVLPATFGPPCRTTVGSFLG